MHTYRIYITQRRAVKEATAASAEGSMAYQEELTSLRGKLATLNTRLTDAQIELEKLRSQQR
jgi:hypothetical protein